MNKKLKKITKIFVSITLFSRTQHDDVKTVTKLSYLGDRKNSGGGREMAVASRTKIGWARFRECHDLQYFNFFYMKMKGIVCKSCVRSTLPYGGETWCLGLNEIGILQRAERAMVSNMCGVKLMDKKSTNI